MKDTDDPCAGCEAQGKEHYCDYRKRTYSPSACYRLRDEREDCAWCSGTGIVTVQDAPTCRPYKVFCRKCEGTGKRP